MKDKVVQTAFDHARDEIFLAAHRDDDKAFFQVMRREIEAVVAATTRGEVCDHCRIPICAACGLCFGCGHFVCSDCAEEYGHSRGGNHGGYAVDGG